MITFFIALVFCWGVVTLAPLVVQSQSMRRALSWAMPIAFGLALVLSALVTEPWQRLLMTTLAMLYIIKSIVLLNIDWSELQKFSRLGLLLYMTVWPGVDPAPFRQRVPVEEDGQMFVHGFMTMICGMLLMIATALCSPVLSNQIVGWTGIFALLLTVHLGYASILTCLMRLAGWNVQPLFDYPFMSDRLQDFWSHRWNKAFVEMNKVLFLPALTGKLGRMKALFAIFAISGVLHELAISYPAKSAVGGPLLYFLIQGVGFILESRTFNIRKCNGFVRRLWTFAWLLLPLPLLFTDSFRAEFILPIVQDVRTALTFYDLRWWFGVALWCAAVGNFCTMLAGVQVPSRLNWREELQRLSNFNRKIILNYYGYTGLVIFAWGTLSIILHQELLNGEKAALCLAFVMGVFWGLRVLVDALWFKHSDWPKGPEMVIGHTCLTALFCALTCTYLGLVAWHWMF